MAKIKHEPIQELRQDLLTVVKDSWLEVLSKILVKERSTCVNSQLGLNSSSDTAAGVMPRRLVPFTILIARLLERQKGQTMPVFDLHVALNDALRQKGDPCCEEAEFSAVLQELNRQKTIVFDSLNVILAY